MDFDLKYGTIYMGMAKDMTEKRIRETYTPEEILKYCFKSAVLPAGFRNLKIVEEGTNNIDIINNGTMNVTFD